MQMPIKYHAVYLLQGTLYGQNLVDDVDAVVAVFNHTLDAAHVAFDAP